MALHQVVLTGTYTDGDEQPLTGQLTFTPSVPLTDTTDSLVLPGAGTTVNLNSSGQFSVSLYSTDSTNLTPTGWTWSVTQSIAGLTPSTWSFFLPYANGATQDISTLTPTTPVTPMAAYLPETGGTMTGTLDLNGSPPIKLPSGTAGYVLTSDGSGNMTPQPLVQAPVSPQALSNGTAITVSVAHSMIPLTATGAVTGITMPASSLLAGQTVTLVNRSAYSVTFAAAGTSAVADGTSDVIAALTAVTYIWDGGTSLWYPVR